MRYTFLLLALFIANIVFGQLSADAAQVLFAHASLNQFIAKHDVREAAKMYTPEFVLVSAERQIGKDEMLKCIWSDQILVELNESENVVVTVEGVTAFVSSVLHQKGLKHGKAFDSKVQVREKWLRTVNGWKISEQQTSIPLLILNETYNE